MKFFRGTFPEIEGISADNFRHENLESSAYFLSHIHSDHTPGLLDRDGGNRKFLDRLGEPGVYVYSSPITTKMLKCWVPSRKDKFLELPINVPKVITVPSTRVSIIVTAIPAGHCVGSVMFLFESEKTILYTGDFRINSSELHKYKPFHDDLGQLKKIDKIYLDVTFFQRKFPRFPTRDQSAEALCKLIQEWIEKSEEHMVHLETGAVYGAEFLYVEIWRRLNMPVHVRDEVSDALKYFPDMDNATTTDGRTTQVHSTCLGHKTFCNPPSNFVRYIKPTAYYWTNWDGKDVAINCGPMFRVCYSAHASFEEVTEFLKFLKPAEVEANVLPDTIEQIENLNGYISDCIGGTEVNRKCFVSETKDVIQIRIDRSDRLENIFNHCSDNSLDSPPLSPVKRKRL